MWLCRQYFWQRNLNLCGSPRSSSESRRPLDVTSVCTRPGQHVTDRIGPYQPQVSGEEFGFGVRWRLALTSIGFPGPSCYDTGLFHPNARPLDPHILLLRASLRFRSTRVHAAQARVYWCCTPRSTHSSLMTCPQTRVPAPSVLGPCAGAAGAGPSP